jgi:hypothetical protein
MNSVLDSSNDSDTTISDEPKGDGKSLTLTSSMNGACRTPVACHYCPKQVEVRRAGEEQQSVAFALSITIKPSH